MLKVQYRMHPDISRVVGSAFYEGLLEDGLEIYPEPRGVPKAFMMLHVDSSSEIFGEQSYYNPIEGECVKILVNWLSKNYKDIGVLSPYSAQVKWLNNSKVKAEVKTIDSFQGREKEVIVFSAVRASKAGHDKKNNPKRTIGFVADGRRLNVALSRAREICVVVGDLERLQLNKTWKSIITQARKR
jgi:superfamily I DNA and/or RNA helicase